jgi:MFS family permease
MDNPRPQSRSFLTLLRNRNFSLLWLGTLVSASGFYVGNVVIEWFIFASTHKPLFLTVLGIVEFVPTLTIGVVAGALADRFDRRRLMIMSDLARALTVGALAAYVLTVGFSFPVILVAVLVMAAFGTIFSPSSSAILPSLIGKGELQSGNGLLQAGVTVSGFVGSPLGGALILLVGVGAGLIYNSLTFAFSALMIGLLMVPAAVRRGAGDSRTTGTSLLSDVRAGLSFLRTQHALLILTLASMTLNFFSFYQLYFVIYSTDVLRGGPAIFGLLVGAQSAGYAAGALLLVDRLGIDRTPGFWIPFLWGLEGLPLITLILVPIAPVAIASVAALGVLSALVSVTFVSAVQKLVPDEFLGRYFATDQAGSFAMVPAGLAVGGVLIVTLGIGFAFLLAGIGTLVAGLALLFSKGVRGWGRS